MAEEKAQYAKPASQLDLEARQANGNKSDRVLSWSDNYEAPEDDGEARTFSVEGNETDNYVGTSSEYATYASETEAPLKGEDSAEEKVAEQFKEELGATAVLAPSVAADTSAEKAKSETKSSTKSSGSTSSDKS